jgi:hemerythrin-like metal-binding protein
MGRAKWENAMETVKWSEALGLDFDPLDAMNRELVRLLACAQTASDDELSSAWAELVAHTAAHFGHEDAWMRDTGHGRADSHALEHRVVLTLLREGLAQAQAGQLASVRQMASELAAWFKRHVQSFDAALALHLRRHLIA